MMATATMKGDGEGYLNKFPNLYVYIFTFLSFRASRPGRWGGNFSLVLRVGV